MEYKIHIFGIEGNSHDQDPIQEDPEIYINARVDDFNSRDEALRTQRDGHYLVASPIKRHNPGSLHTNIKEFLGHYFDKIGPFEHDESNQIIGHTK